MPRPTSIKQTRTILLATDDKNSVVTELAGDQPNPIAYAVYGAQSAHQAVASQLGFNGEWCERIFGWYWLGKGYRAYNPILMRFHSPDSWSPFGEGGLNAYAYCEGDPRNFTDPTGHMFKLPKFLSKLRNKPLTGASSSSSLSPLIPETVSKIKSEATYQTIPAITRKTRTLTHVQTETHIQTRSPTGDVTNHRFIDYGPSREMPPQIPLKQTRLLPRINDTGSQVSTASDEVWRSEPYQFTSAHAPVPQPRKLPSGATKKFRVHYDKVGYPTLSTYEVMTMQEISERLRKTTK
ncbi:hypothetical protein PS918_03670 [Pseudomonas fluorescens]|uniref:RHS repeat-associated core domain-containing protein n=1 Tax=Pseudomonas fluorescens TaxID=294 RepID=A0A5E7TAF1_PSEFL|nr:RHS repeat-associated core domain-containing protein [Pseudomonas fluorescens]VVP95776.1 hypothetical protein PS918_03670 [Pseudomonas fluorescens]